MLRREVTWEHFVCHLQFYDGRKAGYICNKDIVSNFTWPFNFKLCDKGLWFSDQAHSLHVEGFGFHPQHLVGPGSRCCERPPSKSLCCQSKQTILTNGLILYKAVSCTHLHCASREGSWLRDSFLFVCLLVFAFRRSNAQSPATQIRKIRS